MNADRLLGLYERIAEAPNAIPRLRRFVRELAVRGKLLQERKTQGRLSSTQNGKPFTVPSEWRWGRVDEEAEARLGKMLDKAKNVGAPRRYLRNVNVRWFDFDLTDVLTMPFEDRELAEFALQAGDVLVCEGGEPGRAAVWDEREAGIYFQKALHRLRLSPEVDARYFVLALRESADSGRLATYFTGTGIKHLTGRSLGSFEFPIPPPTEQIRIVAKADELMALCDRLEAAQAEREAERDRLTTASLARLNKPDPEKFQEDTRFALDALPALTTRPDQIKQLRQTILNLAVRGKLVAQDPSDEAASSLLKRLHRARRHKRKFEQLTENELEAPLPDIPPKWHWTTIDQLSADDVNAITDGPFGSQLKTEHYISMSSFRVVRLQNIGSGVFRHEHRSYVDQLRYQRLSKHHVRAGDLVVAGLVDPSVRCCEIPATLGSALVKADCYRFAVHPELSSRFAQYFLNSPLAQGFAAIHHHGMTLTRIGLGNFRRIPVPLPPINEQARIVATVDKLMALCDQLEAGLAAAEAERGHLLDGLLSEALAPTSETQRIAAE